MSNRDMALMRLSDIGEAIGLLTRLPVQLDGAPRGAAAAWAYPIAGLAVGLIGACVAWLTMGFHPVLNAGLTLAVMTIVTGALHEDGLADTVDGLWGGWTAERRLEIMKDSHIGTYGVLALISSVVLRWAALVVIADQGSLWPIVLVLATLSRAPMVAVMHVLPNARTSGLSSSTGRPSAQTTGLGLGLAAVLAFVALGFSGAGLVLLLGVTTFAIIAIAARKIGGQTGDILGATQQVSEIAVLIFLLT